jgi:hypothetical protein
MTRDSAPYWRKLLVVGLMADDTVAGDHPSTDGQATNETTPLRYGAHSDTTVGAKRSFKITHCVWDSYMAT